MLVNVYLHTILQRRTPQGSVKQLEVNLPPSSTMLDLIQHLEIELAQEHLLLVVNGRGVETGYVLQEGDKVNLMPALSGGANLWDCPILLLGKSHLREKGE